jgi:hypothetical protein
MNQEDFIIIVYCLVCEHYQVSNSKFSPHKLTQPQEWVFPSLGA